MQPQGLAPEQRPKRNVPELRVLVLRAMGLSGLAQHVTALRQRVWAQHTAGITGMDGGADLADQKVLKDTFRNWEQHAKVNFVNKRSGEKLTCSLVKFYDDRTSTIRFG